MCRRHARWWRKRNTHISQIDALASPCLNGGIVVVRTRVERRLLPLLQVDIVIRRPNGRLEVLPRQVHAPNAMLCHHRNGFLGMVTVVDNVVSLWCLLTVFRRHPQPMRARDHGASVPQVASTEDYFYARLLHVLLGLY